MVVFVNWVMYLFFLNNKMVVFVVRWGFGGDGEARGCGGDWDRGWVCVGFRFSLLV